MSKKADRQIAVSVEEAAGLVCPVKPLIDIRTSLERKMGVPRGAIAMTADEVLSKYPSTGEKAEQVAYILCAEGVRSLTLVQQLRSRGLNGFFTVAGGFKAWTQAGLPTGYPRGLSAEQADRYSRHLVMPQVGSEGQRKLLACRMLLVGLGGQGPGAIATVPRGGNRRRVYVLTNDGDRVVAQERRTSRHHLIKHCAQRI